MNARLTLRSASVVVFAFAALASPAGALAASAKVRILDGTPGASAISLWIDGHKKVNVSYGKVSKSLYVRAGKHVFAITVKGKKFTRGNVLTSSRIVLKSGRHYTIGATGLKAQRRKARLFFFVDNLTTTPGVANVRAAHLVRNLRNLDVGPIVGPNTILPVISNVAYGHRSAYIPLPAINSEYSGYDQYGAIYTTDYGYGISLLLGIAKHLQAPFQTYTLNVNGTHNYTAYAIKAGRKGTAKTPWLKVVLLKDA